MQSLAISHRSGAFEVDGRPAQQVHIVAGRRAEIRRLIDGATGYILNTGPRPMQVRYRLPSGRLVGPSHEYIMPMQAKEIGCAPGMVWEVTDASN